MRRESPLQSKKVRRKEPLNAKATKTVQLDLEAVLKQLIHDRKRKEEAISLLTEIAVGVLPSQKIKRKVYAFLGWKE